MRTQGRRKALDGMRAWKDSFFKHRSVLSQVVGFFVRPQDIEDIVQETFVRSYVASQKDVIHNPRAFMIKTARNLALNSINRAEHKLSSSMEDYLQSDALIQNDTPESLNQVQEQFRAFCHAVAELPVRCRRAFILKKVYGLSQREIADYLGISESTVKKHIIKGMTMTARTMRENGHEIGASDVPIAPHHNDKAQES